MVCTTTTLALMAGALVAAGALTGCTATAAAGSVPAATPAVHPADHVTAPTARPTLVTASPAPRSPAASSGTAAPSTSGSAAAALATLSVKGRAPKTGYSRRQFGQAWADVDRNGCHTRNDVLRRDLTDIRLTPGTNGCQVAGGTLADPYSGTTIPFVRGVATSATVQIDHVVALSNAWQTGALAWTAREREALANDPLNLLACRDGSTSRRVTATPRPGSRRTGLSAAPTSPARSP